MADDIQLQYTKARDHAAKYDGFVRVLTWSTAGVVVLLLILAGCVV